MSLKSYIETLEPVIKTRYLEKLKGIDGVDPYTISLDTLSYNNSDFPPTSYIDIVNYVVYEKSYYTQTAMKAYKSLEAYKYFQSGFIKKVGCRKFDNNVLIMGKVMHSMRMHAKDLVPWVITNQHGQVLSGHCTCMAGLGEVCSHVAALLFFCDWMTRSQGELSCTEKEVTWKPGTCQQGLFQRVRDLDFGKAAVEEGNKLLNIPPLDDTEIMTLLSNCQEEEIGSGMMLVVEPFHKKYVQMPSCANLNILHNKDLEKKSLQEISSVILNVELVLYDSDILRVEKCTRKQRLSKFWYIYRSGRITASVFKKSCVANLSAPPKGLIKRICYPHRFSEKWPAIIWGQDKESVAIDQYEEKFCEGHKDFKIKRNVGLILNKVYPHFGASPDAIVSCCCGKGLVDVKCPFRLRNNKISDLDGVTNSCIQNGALKRTHEYYYQVQMQLFITDSEFADFVVWSETEFFAERVYRDLEFWQINSFKATQFFRHAILPEIIAKHYSTNL